MRRSAIGPVIHSTVETCLQRAGGGRFGLLAAMLARLAACAHALAACSGARALEPARCEADRTFAPRANSVIWIFTNGGPSQVDTWDYKPELTSATARRLQGSTPRPDFFPMRSGRS